MRVLVIDEGLPYPPDSGKRIRTWELLRRLARNAEIVLAFHQEGAVPAAARDAFEEAGIALLPVERDAPRKQGLAFGWDLFRNLFLSVPYMVMAHRSEAMRRAVRAEVARRAPDLLHVEWTPLVANLDIDPGAPVCIAAHNVETGIWERYLEHETSALRRAYISRQLSKLRRFEHDALLAAHTVIAVSDGDAARIRSWTGHPRVLVVPNGVDCERFRPQGKIPAAPGSLVFTGSLDWRPNLDGLAWFLDEVWPLVRAANPSATFAVVGRNPAPSLAERLAREAGVELHASVPDVVPFVARAAVCVVPLRIGGGSRLKIPEALAMEKPVVSTAVGAEGLDLDGCVVIADDPRAFADSVLQAAGPNPRGRELVLERYDWDVLAPLQAGGWRDATSVS